MNIYLYCSYEYSQKGFVLSEFNGDSLIMADEYNISDEAAYFLNYDRFTVLWRDFSDKSFFGVRNLSGVSDSGRVFYANIVFECEPYEADELKNIAGNALTDFSLFESGLISFLSVGGECSYSLDCGGFKAWLNGMQENECNFSDEGEKGRILDAVFSKGFPPSKESEFLHFAAVNEPWKNIYRSFGKGFRWRFRPKTVIDTEKFYSLFK